MTPRTGSGRKDRQRGFSMVEMLMAAFILAVGLLGLATLQIMSLRATRGGQSLTVAVQMAERVMDQIEQEGRQSWLAITDSDYTVPESLDQKYIGQSGSLYVVLDEYGTAGDPVEDKPEGARYLATVSASAPVVAATGRYSDFTVDLEFIDNTDNSGNPIVRHAILTRRIIHG